LNVIFGGKELRMSSVNSHFESDLDFERYLERFDPPPTYEEAISQTTGHITVEPIVSHRRTHPSSDFIQMVYSPQQIERQLSQRRTHINGNREIDRQRKKICFCF
jgi:hypothetical protein